MKTPTVADRMFARAVRLRERAAELRAAGRYESATSTERLALNLFDQATELERRESCLSA